jgi:hypothetical protein
MLADCGLVVERVLSGPKQPVSGEQSHDILYRRSG